MNKLAYIFLQSQLANKISKLERYLVNIFQGLIAVGVVYCMFKIAMILLGLSNEDSSKAKSYAIGLVMAIVLWYAAKTILSELKSL